MTTSPAIAEADPRAVWAVIETGRRCVVIDVRTRAEWTYVGLPELPDGAARLALIEWQSFPAMAVEPDFAERAMEAIEEAGAETAFFLCRSGVRSLHAAVAVSAAAQAAGRDVACVNVTGGFEGDPDPQGRRGGVNGWKAQGLPWRQS